MRLFEGVLLQTTMRLLEIGTKIQNKKNDSGRDPSRPPSYALHTRQTGAC